MVISLDICHSVVIFCFRLDFLFHRGCAPIPNKNPFFYSAGHCCVVDEDGSYGGRGDEIKVVSVGPGSCR
jgi:hypothetical protein